jgi:hypothetical protein
MKLALSGMKLEFWKSNKNTNFGSLLHKFRPEGPASRDAIICPNLIPFMG